MDNPKLSQGVIQGSVGMVQRGKPGQPLYIVEGPETGASIADIAPDATVLASTGVEHLAYMTDVIKTMQPSEVILAVDNDGIDASSRQITAEAFTTLQTALADIDASVRCVYPDPIAGLKKTDWNDVYQQQGGDVLCEQLGITASTQRMALDPTLYYHTATSIAYTPAEKWIRDTKGLVNVNCQTLRYALLGEDNAPTLIVPLINRDKNVQAELLYMLSPDGQAIIGQTLHGNSSGCIGVLQQPVKATKTYIADNLLDAAAIGISEKQANIYVTSEGYTALANTDWLTADLTNGGTVVLTTDNAEVATQARLYAASQAYRDRGVNIEWVKGNDRQHSHASIYDALMATEKVQATFYIATQPLTNTASKEAMTLSQEKEVSMTATRPARQQVVGNYYMTLTEAQRSAIEQYFKASDAFSQRDDYACALGVADSAATVYQHLGDKVYDVSNHPQRLQQSLATGDLAAIRARVLNDDSIRMHDMQYLLQTIATPKMDTQTWNDFTALAKQMKGNVDDFKAYQKAAPNFIEKNGELIMKWRDAKGMPGRGVSPESRDLANLTKAKLNRDILLGFGEQFTRTARDAQHSRTQTQSRDRGGYSR